MVWNHTMIVFQFKLRLALAFVRAFKNEQVWSDTDHWRSSGPWIRSGNSIAFAKCVRRPISPIHGGGILWWWGKTIMAILRCLRRGAEKCPSLRHAKKGLVHLTSCSFSLPPLAALFQYFTLTNITNEAVVESLVKWNSFTRTVDITT